MHSWASTQRCLYGTIRLKFFKGSCTVVGRKSAYSLYDQGLATYDKGDTFNRDAAKGFIEIQTLSTKTWAVNRSSGRRSCRVVRCSK